MLYSIIPPILIIASLVGIIIILTRKSSLIDEEIARSRALEIGEEEMGKTKESKWKRIEHFFLGVLEKVTRKFRVLFLKLESKFSNWSNSIRNKRKVRQERKAQMMEDNKNKSGVIQKLHEYKATRKEKVFFGKSEREEKYVKAVRPIISERRVTPRKAEMKDRLEEILIERIAANPRDVEAYERLGEYYMDTGSYGDSKECFRQVIKLNPRNKNAKFKLKKLEEVYRE